MIKINLLAEGKRPAAVRKVKPSQLLEGKDFGLWLLANSWADWRTLFEERGYATLAPGWP